MEYRDAVLSVSNPKGVHSALRAAGSGVAVDYRRNTIIHLTSAHPTADEAEKELKFAVDLLIRIFDGVVIPMDICPVCNMGVETDDDDFYEVAVNNGKRLAHSNCYHSHSLMDWETYQDNEEYEQLRRTDTSPDDDETFMDDTQTFIKSYGVAKLSPTAFTLDLSVAPNPHIALFQLANALEQATGYWLDFREEPNGQVTEWMLMDQHGTAHKATGTPRGVVIPLA